MLRLWRRSVPVGWAVQERLATPQKAHQEKGPQKDN
jgi:hypothetical protein